MKYFYIPFVSRSKHLERLNALDRQVDALKHDLENAERQLEQYRSAQRGECVLSARCKGCEHCLSYAEYSNRWDNVVVATCALALPQCQQYQPKDK